MFYLLGYFTLKINPCKYFCLVKIVNFERKGIKKILLSVYIERNCWFCSGLFQEKKESDPQFFSVV